MTKSELMTILATKENLTEKQAADIINMIFAGFVDTLKKGDKIELRGFGSFTMRKYKPYTGMNPKSGAKIKVQGKRMPFFRVGRELKKMVDAKNNF